MIGRSIYSETSNTFRKLVSVISISEWCASRCL